MSRKRKGRESARAARGREREGEKVMMASLLLVFVHYTYIKVSLPSLARFPRWQVCMSIRKTEAVKPSFLLGFFLAVSPILYLDKKHTHAHPSSSFFFFSRILFLFGATRNQTDRPAGGRQRRALRRTRKTPMILTNRVRRKDEQERHSCDIVLF